MLNEKLQQAIRKRKLTQRDLARITGESETYISKVVHGERVPDPARRYAWARILRVKVGDIFGEE